MIQNETKTIMTAKRILCAQRVVSKQIDTLPGIRPPLALIAIDQIFIMHIFNFIFCFAPARKLHLY